MYEENFLVDTRASRSLLARVLVGKIEDEARVIEIIRGVALVKNDIDWRCRDWMIAVLAALAADGQALGRSFMDWTIIEIVAECVIKCNVSDDRYIYFSPPPGDFSAGVGSASRRGDLPLNGLATTLDQAK